MLYIVVAPPPTRVLAQCPILPRFEGEIIPAEQNFLRCDWCGCRQAGPVVVDIASLGRTIKYSAYDLSARRSQIRQRGEVLQTQWRTPCSSAPRTRCTAILRRSRLQVQGSAANIDTWPRVTYNSAFSVLSVKHTAWQMYAQASHNSTHDHSVFIGCSQQPSTPHQYSHTCPPDRSGTPDCGVTCSMPNNQRRSGRMKYNFTLSTVDPPSDLI